MRCAHRSTVLHVLLAALLAAVCLPASGMATAEVDAVAGAAIADSGTASPHALAATSPAESTAAPARPRRRWPPRWLGVQSVPGSLRAGDPAFIGPPAPVPPHAPPPDYVARVREAFTETSRLYAAQRLMVRLVEPIAAIGLSLLFLFSGLSARYRDIAWAASRNRYGRMLVYLALYSVTSFVLMLPFLGFGDFLLEHRFGLSSQSLGGWFGDQVKALVIEIVFLGVVPLLALAYLAIEKAPRTWWAWFAAASLPLLAAGTWLVPLLVEPAFNRIQPLLDTPLRREVLALAERAGLRGSEVFEADRSLQTNKLNAYVNGFGSTHRIVLWDTAVRGLSRDELMFVTAHEIGHYQLGHIRQGVVMQSVLNVLGFLLLWLLARAVMRRFSESWGLRGLHDIASLPLLVALISLLSAAAEPAVNAWTRRAEHQADVYALELTRDNDAGARAFLKLAEQNRSDPDPPAAVRVVLYSHPPLLERIRFALGYRPWETGRPNRLFHGRPPSSAAVVR